MPRPAFAAAIVILVLCAPAAEAAVPEENGKIQAIERALETQKHRSETLDRKARDLDREARAVSRKLVALARETRVLERRIADLEARLVVIGDLRRNKLSDLQNQHLKLAKLLSALQRIARNPPEAMLAYSRTAQDVLRSAMLLKSILPQLETQADNLRTELKSIGRLHGDAAKRKANLDKTAAALAKKRLALDQLLKRKRELARTTHAEQERAAARSAKLAAEAKTLRGLLARIEQDRKMPPPPAQAIPEPEPPQAPSKPGATPPAQTNVRPEKPPTASPPGTIAPPKPPAQRRAADGQTQLALAPALRMSRARGRLVPPVVGRIVARFGRKRAIGTRVEGLSFATAAGAQVIAPHRGLVVFAGQFRGYGRLLIIDHGEGYHTLLAGLGRIDVALNQRLLSGEPVGIMAPSGKGAPRLYLELRRNGRPFDPLPWLAASPTDKVSG